MRMVVRGCGIVMAFFLFGCAQNYYNIPRESFEKKIRVLGVAPIMVDANSNIKHPDKDQLVALVKEVNRKSEKDLVARLKESGGYFSVGLLDDDPDQLFSRLFFRRERRDDAGVIYNKYFFKTEELKELMVKNTLDAVMVVVVSGLTKPERIYSSNYLAYLQSDYNYLVMTAQILDADGNILWEYPNFRRRNLTYSPLVSLQYPDFDEAAANVTDLVDIKFKTIPGLKRAFAKTESSPVSKTHQISSLYGSVFDDVTSLLGPEKFLFWFDKKDRKEPAKKEEAMREAKPGQSAQ